ncbi:MAG: IreB family regulatory phosphoprotein [Lachnospiraceae bacterium]|nr:IreB family regulatory phosphoprotein [Lachnospiraceae bacterium]
MSEFKTTKSIELVQEQTEVKEILKAVYRALQTKGYDPVSQIVGYIMSGDPTYITSYANARYLISQVERDDILELLLETYIREVLDKKA